MPRIRRTHVEAERLAVTVHNLRRLGVSRKHIAEFLGLSVNLTGHYLRSKCKAAYRAGLDRQ
jgi:predicted transcriptional regulator